MAISTAKIMHVCTGGNHITIGLLKDSVIVKKFLFCKEELENTIDTEALFLSLLQMAIKKAKATTNAQKKAAIESASWEF